MPFFYQSGVFVMEEIAISKFKATCLAVLEKVKKTGQPILVTRFGHPVVQITPPAPAKPAPKFGTAIGSLTGLRTSLTGKRRGIPTKKSDAILARYARLAVDAPRASQLEFVCSSGSLRTCQRTVPFAGQHLVGYRALRRETD